MNSDCGGVKGDALDLFSSDTHNCVKSGISLPFVLRDSKIIDFEVILKYV